MGKPAHSSSSAAATTSSNQRAVAPAAQAASFKGTLLLLQNKTKRDPESYYEEFMAQLRHFDALSKVATTSQRLVASTAVNAAKMKNNNKSNEDAAENGTSTSSSSTQQQAQEDAQFTAVLNYLCHVSHCYPKECAHIPDVLLKALSTTGPKMNPATRRNFVDNVMLLRSKGLAPPEKTLPVLFDLLLIRDKGLRKAVLGHIVGDIRRYNMPNKAKGAHQSNKVVQNFLFSVVAQDDPTQTRCALLVMIDLYRRGIWANDKCVEVLVQACFSKHTRIIRTALRFFMMQFPKISSLDDNDDDDDFDAKQITETMTRALHKHKAKAKTRYRERVLKRKVKNLKKKLDPELREKIEFDRQDVDPVRLLRDPQTFTERLLAQLQKTSERFEVRLLYLSVIARVVSEHQVVVLPLYSYLERFLQPNQVHAATILALTSTCAHPLIPPDALESLVRSIANHFVNDRSQPDAITIGLNTIREICRRQPLAMSEDLLRDLVEYRSMRGERGIIMASRSLIQLYRQIDPTLLPAKLRGISYDKDESAARRPVFAASRPLLDIPGMEALYGDDDDGGAAQDDDDDQNLSGFEDQLGEDGAAQKKRRNKKNDGDDDDDDDDSSCSSDDSSSMIDIPLSDSDGGGDMNDWEFCEDNDDDDDEEREKGDGEEEDDDEDDDEEEEFADDDDEEDEDDDEELSNESEEDEDDDEDDEDEAHLIKQKRPRAAGDDDDDVWEGSDDDDDEDEKAVKKSRSARAPLKAHKSEDDQHDLKSSLIKTASATAKTSSKKKSTAAHHDGDGDDQPPRLVPNSAFADKSSLKTDPLIVHSSAATGAGWFEDTEQRATKKVNNNNNNNRAASNLSGASSTTTAASRVSTMRLLTEADFEKLRKIQEGLDPNDWRSARGKKKALMELKQKQNALTSLGSTGQVSESAIESFTNRKRSQDKADKIAEAQELRKQRSPFELRKKRKSKLSSTHGEKSKKGKLFQMTKRSARVGAKLKMSVEDRREKAKEMKKKNIKFRINRGWKA